MPADAMTPLLDRKLVFVTGKGGTGKTTVASALALLAASQGKKVLICEVDAKGELADYYESPPTEFKEREVQPGLFAMTMDTEASLREYLKLQLHIPIVGRIGPVAKAFDFLATAAPGVREILTVGKLCFEVRDGDWDMVVVDSQATGHIVGSAGRPAGRQRTGQGGTDPHADRLDAGDAVRPGGHRTAGRVHTRGDAGQRDDRAGRACARGDHGAAGRRGGQPGPARAVRPPGGGGVRGTDHRRAPWPNSTRSSTATPAPVLDAARLAVTMRRTRSTHLERLREGIDPDVPLLYLPYLFTRSHGLRTTRQVAGSLGEELGF